jgi:2-oxoglutarate ferredoxin oxidoreductase subunit beta
METHYCPGCTHGIVHRIIAELLEETGMTGKAIAIAPVGCSVLMYDYLNVDAIGAAHGRAPAVATGIKRTNPDKLVFTYQGDGDLASIGLGEIMSAALRGENISVIFVNNAIYGMTGGQMAPTTLVGQKTTTSPFGRSEQLQGKPIKMCEVLAQVPSATYIERVTLINPAHVRKAKEAIRRSFQCQLDNKGFSMIELVGTCNIGWGMSPVDAMKWCETNMLAYYPLGVYKDIRGEKA